MKWRCHASFTRGLVIEGVERFLGAVLALSAPSDVLAAEQARSCSEVLAVRSEAGCTRRRWKWGRGLDVTLAGNGAWWSWAGAAASAWTGPLPRPPAPQDEEGQPRPSGRVERSSRAARSEEAAGGRREAEFSGVRRVENEWE